MASVGHTSYLGEWANIGFYWNNTARTWEQSQSIDIYNVCLDEPVVIYDERKSAMHFPFDTSVHAQSMGVKRPHSIFDELVINQDRHQLSIHSLANVCVQSIDKTERHANVALSEPIITIDGRSMSVHHLYNTDICGESDTAKSIIREVDEPVTANDAHSLSEYLSFDISVHGNDEVKRCTNRTLQESVATRTAVLKSSRKDVFIEGVQCRNGYQLARWMDDAPWDSLWNHRLQKYSGLSWYNCDVAWSFSGVYQLRDISWDDVSWLELESHAWDGTDSYIPKWKSLISGDNQIKVRKRSADNIALSDAQSKSVDKCSKNTVAVMDGMSRKAHYHRGFANDVHCRYEHQHDTWTGQGYTWAGKCWSHVLTWSDDCWGADRPNSDTFTWGHGDFTWLMHYPSEKKFEHWGVFSWLDTNGYTWNSVWGGSWNENSWLNADGYSWNGMNVHELTWDMMVSKNDSIKVRKRLAQEIMAHDLQNKSISKSLESTIVTSSMLHHKAMYSRLLDDKVHCRHKFNHADWMESAYPWQGCTWSSKDAWADRYVDGIYWSSGKVAWKDSLQKWSMHYISAWQDGCWDTRWNRDTFTWNNGNFMWSMYSAQSARTEFWNGDSWLNADGYSWNGRIVAHGLIWDAMISKNDSIKVRKRLAQEIMAHDLQNKSISKSLESTIVSSTLHKAVCHRLLDDKVHCRHKFNHADWMESTYPWQGCKDAWTDWSDAKWNKDTFTWNNGNFMWSMYSAQSARTEFWNGDSWLNADGYSWNGRIVAHGLIWADCINGNDSVKVFKNIADLAVANDFLNNHVKSINNEGVCIGDIMSKEAQFHRLFVKNMYIREKPLRKIKPQYSCNVNIKDLRVHNSNAVVSDIIIGNNQIPTDAPAGYSDWAQFVSGDYTYKDALVKMEVKSEENATVVEIPEYKVVVDLPDIVDKGIFRIDEPIEKFIPFNVEFYQPPNVAITAVSTDGFDDFYMPVYTTGRTDGFFVKLVGSDKQLKVGMISWQAVGV